MAKINLTLPQVVVDTDYQFQLFLYEHEVSKIYDFLVQVQAKEPAAKQQFLTKNHDYLAPLGDEIRERVEEIVTQMTPNKDTLNLVAQYTSKAWNTYNLWQELMA